MSQTHRAMDGLYPGLKFGKPYGDGTTPATLTFYREKRGGDVEEIEVSFRLDVDEIACVGSSCRVAVYHAKELMAAIMDAAYQRIITPGAP